MEVDNLATAGARVFWTSGDDSAMNATVVVGATNTPTYSNGTPISMAVAGDQLFAIDATHAFHTRSTYDGGVPGCATFFTS